MAKQESMIPNYKNIYLDIISKKFPSKTDTYEKILSKKILSNYDVIVLNKELFPNAKNQTENQKLKSYTKETILKILDYQKVKKLNITELARHFSISRNTIAKWRKIYIVK